MFEKSEEYEDFVVAHERAKDLNRIAGRKEYVVTGAVDGFAVRRLSELLGTPKQVWPPAVSRALH